MDNLLNDLRIVVTDEDKTMSVGEFMEKLVARKVQEMADESERKKNEEAFFKENYEGKYVLITHHENAHAVFGPIPADIRTNGYSKIQSVHIVRDGGYVKMDIENDARLNYYWLSNPYYPQSIRASVRCRVITKNIFDLIMNAAVQAKAVINEIISDVEKEN